MVKYEWRAMKILKNGWMDEKLAIEMKFGQTLVFFKLILMTFAIFC